MSHLLVWVSLHRLQWDFMLLDLKEEEQELSFDHLGRIPMRSVKLLFQVYRFQALAEDVEDSTAEQEGQLKTSEAQKEQLKKEMGLFESIVGDQGASLEVGLHVHTHKHT